jgi:tetratricopeptide (TPR) repeat protein/ADP-heptose:LPS heptosyltransferase
MPATASAATLDMERAVNLFTQGRYREAFDRVQLLLAAQAHDAQLLHLAGTCACMLGLDEQAAGYWKQSIDVKPDFYQSYFSLGFLFGKQGQFDQAEACYRKILALFPQSADAYCALGSLYETAGRAQAAEQYLRKALELDPTSPNVHTSLGVYYMKGQKHALAKPHLERALDLRPGHAPAYNNYGRLHADLSSYAEAEKYYRKAIALDPCFGDAFYNYANLLHATKRYHDAENNLRKAIELNSGNWAAYASYGNLLKDQNRLEEAETAYLKVLSFRPADAEVYSTLGALYIKLKQFPTAEDYLSKALAVVPNHAKSLLNLSFLLLMNERYEEGWPLYEARYRFDAKTNAEITYSPGLPFPQWRGEPLAGKSLVVWHEQGHGDMIQFVRYIPLLKNKLGVRRITLVCKQALLPLMKTLDGVDEILAYENPGAIASHDYWTFPLSIPQFLKTRRETVPSATPYLSAPEVARKKWHGRLKNDEIKVGLVWKGSPNHIDDAERSVPNLEALKPLWSCKGVVFVSLQKSPTAKLSEQVRMEQPLIDLGPEIADFADVAAIIEQLDLVICVDTAIAHLAGALGKEVWVLMRYASDWRWGIHRNDSAWYPTMQLIRQPRRGDWFTVIENVRQGLAIKSDLYWSRIVKEKPGQTSAHFYHACLLQEKGKNQQAEAAFLRVIELKPQDANAYGQLGNLYAEIERPLEAEACYRKVLSIVPNSYVAHNNLGTVLKSTKRHPEAETSFRQAISLFPAYIDAYNNLGNLYHDLGRIAEAEACHRKTIALNPSFISGYGNLGHLFKERGKFAEAEEFYRKALAIQPDNPKSRFILAILLLAQARFEEGWSLFETPYRYDQAIDRPVAIAPFLPYREWRGEPLAGKSLLIWYEQGFGDVIQFSRYAAILKKKGASRITLMCKAPLKALMQTVDGVDRVLCVTEDEDRGTHDYWTFIMSLPLYCKTRLETIPGMTGYLAAPADRRQKWNARLPAEGKKVGLVWKGSVEHKRDHERSLAHLDVLAPLWKTPGVTFVSLQKSQGEDEAAQAPPARPILALGKDIDDFADAAAIIEQLDLVVCVDTAVAHLAGALGKPVWVLTPHTADWRWLLDRQDSPWYPTMRLFRQQARGEWGKVIARVADALDKYMQSNA